MSQEINTVKVQTNSNPDGYYVMNEADFDPKIHRLFLPAVLEPVEPEQKKSPRKNEK